MAEQTNSREIVILWQASRLLLNGNYVVSPEILKVHGSPVATLGNFSASIGKAKSKKTFNVSAIVAAALKNGTVLQYAAELPENKRKILYVDTEQSAYHCQKVMQRIARMADLPLDRQIDNLEFLTLRKYTPEIRIAIVETAIYHTESANAAAYDCSAKYEGYKDLNDCLCDKKQGSKNARHCRRTFLGKVIVP